MKLLKEYLRLLLEAPARKAVIVMANARHLDKAGTRAQYFYNELAKFMQRQGYETEVISAYDGQPSGVDVALVHSHGFEHISWPRGTTVIPLGSIMHNAVNHPRDANAMRSKFIPGQRYVPPQEHWALTDIMRGQIKARLGAEQDKYDSDVDNLDSKLAPHASSFDDWSRVAKDDEQYDQDIDNLNNVMEPHRDDYDRWNKIAGTEQAPEQEDPEDTDLFADEMDGDSEGDEPTEPEEDEDDLFKVA